jgi:hypothetical protein
MGPVLDLSNRSQSASNRVCWITYGILKIGDQRLVREIGRMSPKIQKIAPQRFRSVSLTRGNVAPIFANRTSLTETGLVGWGGETRTTESIWTEIRLSCRENLARFGSRHCSETVPV